MEAAEFLYQMKTNLTSVDVLGNTFLHCVSSSDSKELWRWALSVMKDATQEFVEKKNMVSVRSLDS